MSHWYPEAQFFSHMNTMIILKFRKAEGLTITGCDSWESALGCFPGRGVLAFFLEKRVGAFIYLFSRDKHVYFSRSVKNYRFIYSMGIPMHHSLNARKHSVPSIQGGPWQRCRYLTLVITPYPVLSWTPSSHTKVFSAYNFCATSSPFEMDVDVF